MHEPAVDGVLDRKRDKRRQITGQLPTSTHFKTLSMCGEGEGCHGGVCTGRQGGWEQVVHVCVGGGGYGKSTYYSDITALNWRIYQMNYCPMVYASHTPYKPILFQSNPPES